MKIKIAILDKDEIYLSRLTTVFSNKYSDKFEIYSFSDLDIAMKNIVDTKIDIFISSDLFEIPFEKIPQKCGFAYFVDSPDIETLYNRTAICKYQKVDLIYKQLLSIYSEKVGNVTGLRFTDDGCKLIAFTSPSGGVGTSTVAASCALHFALHGKKTLYLNLEDYGSSDVFFSSEGQFTFSDIIYALKSNKANLSMKLESCVKQDENGVFFFSQPNNSLDMLELSSEDVIRLLNELKLTCDYEYIVIDMQYSINDKKMEILKLVDCILLVSDGKEISNEKLLRSHNALCIMEQSSDINITGKMLLFYNKFSNKTSVAINNIDIKNIGGAPKYENANTKQIMRQLAQMSVFDSIFG